MHSRRMSYFSLQSTIPKLSFGQRYSKETFISKDQSSRMSLSRISTVARGINKRTSCQKYSIDYVNFFHEAEEKTKVEGFVSLFQRSYSGRLQVESVHYVFDNDEGSEEVSITCSLDNFKTCKKSSNKYTAHLYFGHFISNTTHPVKHIDIEVEKGTWRDPIIEFQNCKYAFSGLKNLRIPSLRWTLDGTCYGDIFAGFAEGHVFERVELNNPSSLTICETVSFGNFLIDPPFQKPY